MTFHLVRVWKDRGRWTRLGSFKSIRVAELDWEERIFLLCAAADNLMIHWHFEIIAQSAASMLPFSGPFSLITTGRAAQNWNAAHALCRMSKSSSTNHLF